MRSGFRLRENATGSVLSDSGTSPRGDLHETTNGETAVGCSAAYRIGEQRLASWLSLRSEPGLTLRHGWTDQMHSLVSPVDLAPWQRVADRSLETTDLGAYGDVDVAIARVVHVAGGLRADALIDDVDDHRAAVPQHASAATIVPSPRVSLALDVQPWLRPVVSYGEGFRSPSAEGIAQGHALPYAKVRTVEAGMRADLDRGRYVLALTWYRARLSDELVYDAESGALEDEGKSTRKGVEASAALQATGGLIALVAVTTTDATLDATGDPVPKVPRVMVRSDMGWSASADVFGGRTTGRIGWGLTYLGARPLEDGSLRRDTFVVNASASARRGAVELEISAFNLLDRRYADDELLVTSNWSSGPLPRLPSEARHMSAAAPRTVLASLALHL
jgi:outer membrane receptor protein involved in Fe transport